MAIEMSEECVVSADNLEIDSLHFITIDHSGMKETVERQRGNMGVVGQMHLDVMTQNGHVDWNEIEKNREQNKTQREREKNRQREIKRENRRLSNGPMLFCIILQLLLIHGWVEVLLDVFLIIWVSFRYDLMERFQLVCNRQPQQVSSSCTRARRERRDTERRLKIRKTQKKEIQTPCEIIKDSFSVRFDSKLRNIIRLSP